MNYGNRFRMSIAEYSDYGDFINVGCGFDTLGMSMSERAEWSNKDLREFMIAWLAMKSLFTHSKYIGNIDFFNQHGDCVDSWQVAIEEGRVEYYYE